MQAPRLPILGSILTLGLLAGCGSKPEAPANQPAAVQPAAQQPAAPKAQLPAGHVSLTPPSAAHAPAPGAAPAAAPAAAPSAKVLETMDAGGYTYAKLDAGGKQDWYAVGQCSIKVGDTVLVPADAFPQYNLESKSLNRKFDVIYFAGTLQKVGGEKVGGEAAAMVQQAHSAAAKAPAPAVDLKGIVKPEGGMTVAEIWALEDTTKDVILRGKVVKFNGGILGKNWLHVRDGSGDDQTNDITITTDAEVKVGDIVLVKGKLSKDRDFSAGYIFARILEDAAVTVE